MALALAFSVSLITPAEADPASPIASPAAIDSNACLSCHDGSSAIAVRHESSHSWHVVYEDVRRVQRIRLKASTAPSGLGATIAEDLLVDGRLECTTCHFDHEVSTSEAFRLRGGMPRLCLSCHILD